METGRHTHGPRALKAWLSRWLGRVKPSLNRGAEGERIAARHLKRQGYRILTRNVRTTLGEVDLVAEAPNGRTVIIVEVKAGAGERFSPEVHFSHAKQRRLIKLGWQLLRRQKMTDRPWRIDLIAVHWPSDSNRPAVRHYANAVTAGR
jgi:putative endonuclease